MKRCMRSDYNKEDLKLLMNKDVDTWWADSTAVVEKGAIIGGETRIWHFSHICSGAVIGRQCTLGQNTFVADECTVGDRVKIQNNVSLFAGVQLESDVFIGPSVVFTNVINPRAFIDRKTEFKQTIIKQGATIGANCTILCGNTVGEFSMVGAGATVTNSVKPFALMMGIPARQVGWVSRNGVRLNLPLFGHDEADCSESAMRYQLVGDCLKEIEIP